MKRGAAEVSGNGPALAKLSTHIPEELHTRVKVDAAKRRMTMAQFIVLALEAELKRGE